jgi:hypothetical protein
LNLHEPLITPFGISWKITFFYFGIVLFCLLTNITMAQASKKVFCLFQMQY